MLSRFLKTGPVVLALALLPAARAAAQPEVVSITRRASPAVITLHTYSASGRETGLGSGWFLPDGRIVTNRHVVEGSGRVDATTADNRRLGSAQYAEAVGGPTADLAILPRITNPPATLPLARTLPEVGEAIVVIGAPEGFSNTVSTGIVSAIRNDRGRQLLQISAPISHGSSGGPVLNMRGEVVGVSVAMWAEGQNLNFAVPVTEVSRLSQTRPGRIAFNSDLRFGSGVSSPAANARDISSLDTRSLPRIATGQTVTGRLSEGDFVRPDGSYADAYVYNGRAGEQITVTLRSSAFDAWLVVDDPNGPMREHDDDSAGNLDSELTVTLPHAGQYLIVANSVNEGATGAYTMSVRSGGGGRVAQDDNNDNSVGGQGDLDDLDMNRLPRINAGQTVNGQLTTSDFLRSDNTYADPYVYYGRAGERLTITLRSDAFDSWVVITEPGSPFLEHDDDGAGGNDSRLTVTLPHTGRYIIAANTVGARDTGPYSLTVESSGGGGGGGSQNSGQGTAITDLNWRRLPAISAGQVINGRLSTSDVLRDDNTYMDAYVYQGRAGERITITLRSGAFDSWLVVNDPNGPMYEHDDDSAGGNDARLTLTLPHSGPYVIVANSVSQSTGPYTLSVTSGGSDRVIRPLP